MLDSSNTTISPSLKLILFLRIKDICESDSLSAQIAEAPLVCPVKISPIIISDVFPVGPVIDENTTVGADGLERFGVS